MEKADTAGIVTSPTRVEVRFETRFFVKTRTTRLLREHGMKHLFEHAWWMNVAPDDPSSGQADSRACWPSLALCARALLRISGWQGGGRRNVELLDLAIPIGSFSVKTEGERICDRLSVWQRVLICGWPAAADTAEEQVGYVLCWSFGSRWVYLLRACSSKKSSCR